MHMSYVRVLPSGSGWGITRSGSRENRGTRAFAQGMFAMIGQQVPRSRAPRGAPRLLGAMLLLAALAAPWRPAAAQDDPYTITVTIDATADNVAKARDQARIDGQRKALPIVAFMAGRFMDEMPGMSFGHAGTIVEGKEDTASEKIARLAAAGITVAERIEEIPELISSKIAARSPA